MKKLFFTFCLMMAAFNTFAGDSILIGDLIPLELLNPDTNPLPGHPRSPILTPQVSIDGYTLYFWDASDFLIYIKEEDENGDEQVVYSAYVPSSQTTVNLPSYLCGTYTIEVVRDGITFQGEIELE